MSSASVGPARIAVSESVLYCGICNEPLTACFHPDSHVAWAECFAGGHHYVQNIFTPTERGSNHGYTYIEVEELNYGRP